MKRRAFISLLGGAAAAWPLAARAQQAKTARIGALYLGTADAESFKKELREGLRERGFVEGQNIAFEFQRRVLKGYSVVAETGSAHSA
jgi:putative tryptophan/tyrosine transport system substrate-binding protein